MAIWQVRGWILPSRSISGKAETTIARAIRTGQPNLWRGLDRTWLGAAKELRLANSAPDSQTRIWGDPDGHYVMEAGDGGGITEVEIGIDIRRVDAEFVRSLVALLARLDARLVLPSGRRLPSTERELMKEFAESPAARFVTNPHEFLDSLSLRPRPRRSRRN